MKIIEKIKKMSRKQQCLLGTGIIAALAIVIWILLPGGKKTYAIPSTYAESEALAPIYPDYCNITIPSNIAPLNFMVDGAEELVADINGHVYGGTDRIDIPEGEWHKMLQDNEGKELSVNVYVKKSGNWTHYKPHTLTIAEPIDPYLSYRLIEPGYELYRQLGLYQRNLTNFEQKPIYENNRSFEKNDNHCVNCHNYKNNSTQNMLFHVRANHGGTIFVDKDGKAHKVQLKADTILTAGVYPSWHPTRNLVAFSTNQTGQIFHLYNPEKIEVLDEKSDLFLYDLDKNEMSIILNQEMELETFPCWTPSGDRLFYCVAIEPEDPDMPEDSDQGLKMMRQYRNLKYNIMSMDFDGETYSWSEPKMEVECSAKGKSASFPKVSPDGRYVLYAEGDYGQFHIWHKTSDLWVKDLQTDSCYALTEANSDDVDSYHTWSSNGRWIVFSTRRMDGNYTRPFIAYFDKQGHARKAFCMPQRDPEHNILLLKSYNVPELTKDAVRISPDELKSVIYGSKETKATMDPRWVKETDTDATTGATEQTDAETGASPQTEE